MKFFKTTIILFLLCFSFSTTIYASQVSSSSVNEFSNNTVISGSLPTVTTSNASLTKVVNNEISNIYTKRANGSKNSNAKSVTFSYEVFESGNYTSIVIKSKVSKLKSVTTIDTIVYDDTKVYTLDTYLSSSDLKVFNKSINDKIKQSPENYKVSEVTLNDKTAFYIKNNTVFVGFDGETVASSNDVVTFSYIPASYDVYTLTKDSYYIQGSTQIKYVPIREVYNNLGYNVSYKNKSIYITDSNNKSIATFDTEETDKSVIYTASFGVSQRYKSLVYNGTAYTPLSVIQSSTGVVYDIQSNGDIVFPLIKTR